MPRTHLALIAILTAACGEPVPDAPTYKEHVRPILQANCARCHSFPVTGGAPPTFSLTTYGQAAAMIPFVHERACVQRNMPPVGPKLSERQCEILRAWCGGRCDTQNPDYMAEQPEGDLPGNSPPTARIVLPEGLGSVDARLDFLVVVDDAENDPVSAYLDAVGAPLAQARITNGLHGGVNSVGWSTSAIPPGTYPLRLTFSFDNAEPDPVELATVTIEHPGANTAPYVKIFEPTPSRLIRPEESPVAHVQVADFDGDIVTLSLHAIRGDDLIPVAGPVPVRTPLASCDATPLRKCTVGFFCIDVGPENQCVPEIPWDPDAAGVEDGTNWRLRVTASDGQRATVEDSPEFIVSRVVPTVTAADLGFLCEGTCDGCHSRPDVPTVEWRECDKLYTVTSGRTADRRGELYRRIVQRRDMPPVSGKTLIPGTPLVLSSEERAIFGEWLLGGAQECLMGERICP